MYSARLVSTSLCRGDTPNPLCAKGAVCKVAVLQTSPFSHPTPPQERDGRAFSSAQQLRLRLTQAALNKNISRELALRTRTSLVDAGVLSYKAEEVKESKEDRAFVWTEEWYPVAAAAYLDPKRPHPVTLLGRDFVLWSNGQGSWNCFQDKCPHRLAPLSEGRIEADGQLLCAYHGWRFNSQGHCTDIPQAKKTDMMRLASSPRACATKYPLVERGGLLWLWPESGPEAERKSAQKQPLLPPEVEDTSGCVSMNPWYIRDVDYGYEVLAENLCDPAHVPVTHHNVAGSRYSEDQYLNTATEEALDPVRGFKVGYTMPYKPKIERATTAFSPPILFKFEQQYPHGGRNNLVLYTVPVKPGWSKFIGCQLVIKNELGQFPEGFGGILSAKMPIWLGHVLSGLFFNQDMVFLHHQQRIIQQQPHKGAAAYYMPTPSDRPISMFHDWLQRYGGGAPTWPPSTPSQVEPIERNQDKLFDIYQTHTKNCLECQKGLQLVTAVRDALLGLAVVCGLQGAMMVASSMAAAGAPIAATWWSSLPVVGFLYYNVAAFNRGAVVCWLGAAVCLATAGLLQKLRGMFFIVRFSHADND